MKVYVFSAEYDGNTETVAVFDSKPTREDCWAALRKHKASRFLEEFGREPSKQEVADSIDHYVGSGFVVTELMVVRPDGVKFT